jgi:hypothetical protein
MMNNPYTGGGCVPEGTEVLAVPVDAPNKCPNGYQSQRSYNEYKRITEYYCYKLPDMVSEREQLKRQECIKLGLEYDPSTFACKPKTAPKTVPKTASGSCPPGYTTQFLGYAEDGITPIYSEDCIDIQSQDSDQNDGGGGDGGDGGGGDGGGGGSFPFYKVCPGGSVVAIGDPCPSVTVEEGEICWGPRGPYPRHPEYGCGKPPDEKGAAGGYVKKGKIRKKKYQAGGIASLTRDPNLGAAVNMMDGYNFGFAQGGMAAMPEYQAGGKLLRGAGDGMSDDIPAVIRGKGVQRAALADGEFVIPADVVSHLGNGSTEAGAKKLYKMMAQIRAARTGRKKQAPRVNADKYLPRV